MRTVDRLEHSVAAIVEEENDRPQTAINMGGEFQRLSSGMRPSPTMANGRPGWLGDTRPERGGNGEPHRSVVTARQEHVGADLQADEPAIADIGREAVTRLVEFLEARRSLRPTPIAVAFGVAGEDAIGRSEGGERSGTFLMKE